MLYLCSVFFMVLDFKVNEKSRRDDDSFCFIFSKHLDLKLYTIKVVISEDYN